MTQRTTTAGIILLPEHATLGQGRDNGNIQRIKEEKRRSNYKRMPPTSFYYSCRRVPALRSRTAADTTFYISTSACALVHKVRKSHFTESYNKKIVCSSQQVTEESCLPYKINFYIVIYSLTSLIGNKDNTIEKKQRLERYICT